MMPEKSNGLPYQNEKSNIAKRRNSDPLTYNSSEEEADTRFLKLCEDTLQDLLVKVKKENSTSTDFREFLDHQQKYVFKLQDEVRSLQEEKQKMSLELFRAKMEVDLLKKQSLNAYEPGYITGLVHELHKSIATRSEVISNYCDHVNSLAYQKSQQYVPFTNQVPFQPTFRPFQNGHNPYPPQFTNPYGMNPNQPPRGYAPYSMPSYYSDCDRPSFRGSYGVHSSSPLSSLSPASNHFAPNYPRMSPQMSKAQAEGRVNGPPLEAVNQEMHGYHQCSDPVPLQPVHQVPIQYHMNGQGWANGQIMQPDPWTSPPREQTLEDPLVILEANRKRLEKDLVVSSKLQKKSQGRINELENELHQLKKQVSQISLTNSPKNSNQRSPLPSPHCSPQLRSARIVEIDSPKYVCFPVAESDENLTEDLKKAEHDAIVEFDRTLAEHFSGGSLSSEDVFEEADKHSIPSGSPFLKNKQRNSPRCGVSSLGDLNRPKDFPFSFLLTNRDKKLNRSASDSESGKYASRSLPSYVKVLGPATEL